MIVLYKSLSRKQRPVYNIFKKYDQMNPYFLFLVLGKN